LSSKSDPEDPAVSYDWLLGMARRTLDAPPADADPHLTEQLSAQLADRPSRDEDLGQLHIDTASCLRRAALVRADGPVLAVGDDDGVTLALRLLGQSAVVAADLDERLLAFLGSRGVETHRANFLEQAVPGVLRSRFASVVTDPFRDLDGGLGFLCFASACVRDGGDLYWVDDPDWNPEHDAVRSAMAQLGWRVMRVHNNVHAYPLSPENFVPDALVEGLGLDAEWLDALITHTSAWSNLYQLQRTTPAADR